jgi:hypothetical protein
MNGGIKVAKNPSNLVAPVKVNSKLIKCPSLSKNFEIPNVAKRNFDKSIQIRGRSTKTYSVYEYESDLAYEDKSYVKSLIPRIFYKKHKI